ncbi:MAG TPA: energy-coupling factor transporter ATPase [Firmicutes bacterium]|nr:energy-coupling factor transporter ATPase [Bacillota bacterium]
MSIVVSNLSYTYAGGTPLAVEALSGIDLTVGDGEFVGLIGHTGSGKSTLVQHLNGLIKPPPGRVVVDGIDLGAKRTDLRAIRQRVGLVFQYPEHQVFEETIFADIAFGVRNLHLSSLEVEERVREAMTLVGLDYEALKDRSPLELSGGQLRRVAIAGVLAMKPRTLILDEPTAGLDPRGRDDILGRIAGLRRDLGLTVILVSHHLEELAPLVDRLVVLERGRVLLAGPPREVFQQAELLRSVGLDVPATVRLLHELRERGIPVEGEALTVDEAFELLQAGWERLC